MFSAEAVAALLAKQRQEFEEAAEQAAAAAATTARHELGRTNPLLFPPHLYTKEVLQINQPFLFFSKKRLPADKSRVKMDEDVLLYIIQKALVRDLNKAHKLYKEAKKETTLRPLHLALLSGFFELTRPSLEANEELKRLTEMFTRVTGNEDDEDAVENETPDSEGTDDLALFLGDESDGDDEPEDEEKDEGEAEASSIDSSNVQHDIPRTDITVQVYDRVRDCWVTVCTIQGKQDALSQAMRYGCARGLINLQQGRVAPIYVMAWSASMWSYGMLDIFGAVSIKSGQVDMADFQAQQEVRWKILRKTGDFTLNSNFTMEELSRKLERSKGHLRMRYEGKEAEYKDGAYIVANVYMSNEKFALPTPWDVQSPSAMLFYEMLLRIIVGERVIKWTRKDVDDAYAVRKRMLEATCTMLTSEKRRKLSSSSE